MTSALAWSAPKTVTHTVKQVTSTPTVTHTVKRVTAAPKAVTHTVTAGGHQQALTLTRNALGRADTAGTLGGSPVGSLGVSVGVSL